jgi:hypothetical protein
MSADITVSKQRGRPFAAGISGNPDGRPKGSRNKLTETFLDTVAKDFAEMVLRQSSGFGSKSL